MSLVFADDSELFDLPVLEPSDRGQEVPGVGQAVSSYRKLTHDSKVTYIGRSLHSKPNNEWSL